MDSEPGQGTTVRIQIPKDRGPETGLKILKKKISRPEGPDAERTGGPDTGSALDMEERTKEDTGYADTVR